MTTLAGHKIRRFRDGQVPKLTRAAFGAPLGVGGSTVQGWEDDGKTPRAAVVNMLAARGVVRHADWYVPALCTRCQREADSQDVATCREADCPMAIARVA